MRSLQSPSPVSGALPRPHPGSWIAGKPCWLGPGLQEQKPPLIPPLLLDPFARLAVWCALSSYSSHKGQASSRQKKRHREDIEVERHPFPFPCLQMCAEPFFKRHLPGHRQQGMAPAPGPLCVWGLSLGWWDGGERDCAPRELLPVACGDLTPS